MLPPVHQNVSDDEKLVFNLRLCSLRTAHIYAFKHCATSECVGRSGEENIVILSDSLRVHRASDLARLNGHPHSMGDREAAECITARGTPALPTPDLITHTINSQGRVSQLRQGANLPPPCLLLHPPCTCIERGAIAIFVYASIARGRETRTSQANSLADT